jgi:HSP20 family protein
MRFDPFREMDRLVQAPWATVRNSVPMDVYRRGDQFLVRVDLPGIDPSSIDLQVEKNVLTLQAERSWAPSDGDEVLVSERPQGTFTRRLFLGDGLDTEGISATYENGVLSILVPVAETAKSRKVQISLGEAGNVIDAPAAESIGACPLASSPPSLSPTRLRPPSPVAGRRVVHAREGAPSPRRT